MAYNPPDPEVLKQARDKRLKEIQMYDILREILFYCFFLWILMVISYGFRDPNAHVMKDHITNEFISIGSFDPNDVKMTTDFMKVCFNLLIYLTVN